MGGLTQLGAREYDPGTGRFLSVDPVFDSSDPQSLNGYSYGDDNPTTLSDPSGLHIPTCQTQGECGPPVYLPSGGGGGRGPSSSPPPPQHHCGWTCSVGNFWNKHKAVIVNVTVTIVVTAGCEAATGGTGSVGCAVVGGMAGNWAGYRVSTPQDQQTLGGALKAEAWGAVQGAASWGLAKAGGLLLGKVATTSGGRAVTKLISKAGSDGDGAVAKITGKAATSGGADGAEAGAGGGVEGAAGKGVRPGIPGAVERLEGRRQGIKETLGKRRRPGTVSEMEVRAKSGLSVIFQGTAGKVNNETATPPLKALLDTLVHPHGACSEIHCIDQAVRAGFDPRGATITTMGIQNGRVGATWDGEIMAPCQACQRVLDVLDITSTGAR